MSADIKLFVSCHKRGIHIPDNRLLQPIHVGAASSAIRFPGMPGDDTGDSISGKNRSYCELTAQYWAWKNSSADYYGFLHYRRYFNFSSRELPTHHEPFIFGDVVCDDNDDKTLSSLDFLESDMRPVIEAHDFVAPTPIESLEKETVYENYRYSVGHHIEDLDTVIDIIRLKYPEIWPSAKRYLNQTGIYACNMFIMRRDLFLQYSSFLFDVLDEHERLRDISHYSSVARRVSGYLGERICGMFITYLYDKGYDGIDLQRVYFRNAEDPIQSQPSNETPAGQASESVFLKPTPRPNGETHIKLAADAASNAASLRVKAKTSDGIQVPAKIITRNASKTLVLASVNRNQTVSLYSDEDDGTEHLLGSQTLTTRSPEAVPSDLIRRVWRRLLPKSLRGRIFRLKTRMKTLPSDLMRQLWRSIVPEGLRGRIFRLKTRMKTSPVGPELLPGLVTKDEIQSMDEDARIVVDAIIDNLDKSDIIHGRILIPVQNGAPLDDFVEISALGLDGATISLGDWVCLGDEIHASESLPNLRVRKVSFSLHIPRARTFIIWVRFPDHDTTCAFTVISPDTASTLRRAWLQRTTPASAAVHYDNWFRTRQRANANELAAQRRSAFAITPKYSIIVPLYKTPIPFFQDMAASVIGQSYSQWELILVNASSQDHELGKTVEELCLRDKRVKTVTLESNEGITLNTNEGIKAATGDFLCFLDHDDVLEPDALYCYTRALNKNRDIDMFYCDEDKLDSGRYREPFFKTEWNPDLLLGMNYVCHFLAVRKTIVDDLELPGKEYDGSQDWHMTFRVGERARAVHHEARVLYHWRVHNASTALRADQKDYTLDSSRIAVQTHLDRSGIAGTIVDSPLMPRRFAVDYDLGDRPLVSIIIPNKDAVATLHQCLSSIRKYTTYSNYEIVIVENNSTDRNTFDYYDEIQQAYPQVNVVELTGMSSFNFSRIINVGASRAHGEYFLLLNNDTEIITPDWIEQLLGPCMRKDVGVTGAKLLFPDNTVQHAGISFGPDGPGHLYYQTPESFTGNFEATMLARDLGAVTGACLMVSKATFDLVGGFEETLAVNYNDVDFCLKVLGEGQLVVFCPTAQIRHYESVSRGADDTGPKALRFLRERGEFMSRWPEAFTKSAPYENTNMQFGNVYQVLNQNYKRSSN